MKNVRPLLIGLLAASTLAFSPMSQAQMSADSWYAGIGVGQGKGKDVCSGVAQAQPGVTVSSCDDKSNGYRAFAGFTLTKNFFAEFGYADFGKADASGTVNVPPVVPFTATWKATVWDVSALGVLPVAVKFSVFGRLGIAMWNVDLDVNASGFPVSESSSGADPVYGLGVQYDFTDKFGLRGEWMRYSNVGDSDTTGQTDVDVMGVSLLYRFYE